MTEKAKGTWKSIKWNWDLYLLLFPTVVYFILFAYLPMYGVVIAFKDYMPAKGFAGSELVGLKWFEKFLNAFQFRSILTNTLSLSIYSFLVGFPIPIVCALLLNQIPSARYKQIIQTVTYAPNFISMIVIVGMLKNFLSPTSGILTKLIVALGGNNANYMGEAKYFRHVYVWSGMWQGLGVSMIVYLAALTGVDPQLHEAATIDGATKFKRILHIDIPGILPTVSVLLILNIGGIMNVGFDKVYLMQNSLNSTVSETISTYVYKIGLLKTQYSYSSAIGLFNSVINCILLVMANAIIKVMGEESLW
jgi:putative aldouronate transport system permease protein